MLIEWYNCRRCKEKLPITSFRVRVDRTNYRVKSCYVCEKKENQELREIHKVAPKQPDFCDCCGKGGKLHLDHCHKTLSFRGWICGRCNSGIGNLGDEISGLQMAIDYLKKKAQ
jgi:hypothetical protein